MTPGLGIEETQLSSGEPLDRATPFRLAKGDEVGHYRIVGVLGAGGMAEVYRARDQRLGREVALKFVRPVNQEGAACGMLCSLLMKEARTMARLSHPGFPSVHDIGEHGGCVYIAMELLEAVTLRERVSTSPGWRETLNLLLSAGEALSIAHTAKVVHRDVKPDNVLVCEDRVVVSDFGLARSLADFDEASYACGCTGGVGVYVEQEGKIVGTPRYMSPEQLEGKAADSRSDQFSFAVTCWEMLHGALPFDGHSIDELHRVIQAQLFSSPAAGDDVPAAVDEALRRGMRVAPSGRYPNMKAFLDRLRAASSPANGPRA